MITKRQNEILKVIVEEYIRTAKPVVQIIFVRN